MKLIANFQAPRINLSAYKTAAHRYYSWVIASALRDWLVATRDTIPIYTGASRETFTPLASQVEFGSMNGPSGGRYSFTYDTTLAHLIINEYYDARQWGFHLIHPGPYNFQERGKKAFLANIASMSLYPVKPFIIASRITV
jgi:hypothetical protein